MIRKVWNVVASLLRSSDGLAAVEYALFILLALLACLTAITVVGRNTACPNGAEYSVERTVPSP